MILPGDRLIFVHIQKTGGSSVTSALGGSEHPPEKHWLARELRDRYGRETWNDCYRFAFVRNPWDRLVSWWSMIDNQKTAIAAGARANTFFRYVLERAETFEDFLHKCGDEVRDPDGRKCIWRNQLDYLCDEDGVSMVDFIGRFETLDQDFAAVTRHVYGASRPLPRTNASRRRPYVDYYTPELTAMVTEAYADDIAAFGYRFGE